MDYKYIECLIERYFDCTTTQEEEQILHNFFRQKEIPAHLESYADLFRAYDYEAQVQLPADFDQKVMERIEAETQSSAALAQNTAALAQNTTTNAQDTIGQAQDTIGQAQDTNVKPQRPMRFKTIHHALAPFYKAVASIALIITVGVSSSQYWNRQEAEPVEYNYSNYNDTFSDPEVACEQLNDALKDLSDAFRVNGMTSSDSLVTADSIATTAWLTTQTN